MKKTDVEKRAFGNLNRTDWITIDDKVRHLRDGKATGEKWMGEGENPTAWLFTGAIGTVRKISPGFPRHRCPDHHLKPACICGGSECAEHPGWIEVHASWATVEYETDVPGRTIKRAIQIDEEGNDWERVC